MKVQDLLVRLSENELANLDLGSSGAGCLSDENMNKVIHAINSVLTTLHRKYVLKTGDYTLITVGTVLEYQVSPVNFIKYLSAKCLTENIPVPINDNTREYSITTYGSGKLKVPSEGTYVLTYQANHPLINKANLGQALDVPSTLIQAICDWVAYVIYGSMNTVENVNTAIRYLTHYNQELADLEKTDSLGDSRLGVNSKFVCNGWI